MATSVQEDTENGVATTTTADSTALTPQKTETERHERRFLIQRPQPLQYFYKGRLFRNEEKERIGGRFELFLDLLYVALVANFADHLAEEPSGTNLVIYIITFIPAWHAWADIKENHNSYYNDDLLQRIAILWIMALLVLYGNNANAVGESIDAQRITVASYMVIRLTQSCMFGLYSLSNVCHKWQNRGYVVMTFIGLFIWIPIYFETVSNRAKIAVTVVAIVWEEFSYFMTFGPWLTRWLKLDYQTAADIEHENERYTAFTIIVLGEFTYAILVGSPAEGGLNLNILRAIWTLVIAFCFNSIYIYNDGAVHNTHPIRRSVWTAFGWLMIHLPMVMGLLIGGHVSAAATAATEETELDTGRRWLWGGGLAVGMLSMWVTAQLYRDDDRKDRLAMSKQVRLAPRLVAVLVYALIPLADEEHLSATGLVSIGAAVSAFVVVWETVGALECGARPFESWKIPPQTNDSGEDLPVHAGTEVKLPG